VFTQNRWHLLDVVQGRIHVTLIGVDVRYASVLTHGAVSHL